MVLAPVQQPQQPRPGKVVQKRGQPRPQVRPAAATPLAAQQVAPSPRMMIKSNNLSMLSPDQLPELPLDIQEKIVQFSSANNSSNSNVGSEQSSKTGGATTTADSQIMPDYQKAEQIVVKSGGNVSNLAVVRPQQQQLHQQHVVLKGGTDANPAVRQATQVILRPNANSQQILINNMPSQQQLSNSNPSSVNVAIPVTKASTSMSSSAPGVQEVG